MGSRVVILKGDKKHRTIEGIAEIKNVKDYKGDGWYEVECVFEKGAEAGKLVKRNYNIDEIVPVVKKGV